MKKILLTLAATGMGTCCVLPSTIGVAALYSVPGSTALEACAVKIINITERYAMYFYTNKWSAGQDVKWIHDIPSHDWTWDWVNEPWSGWQMEICISSSTGDENTFVAFAFMQSDNGEPILYKYTVKTQASFLTPSWDVNQWERSVMTIWYDGWNYHSEFYIN